MVPIGHRRVESSGVHTHGGTPPLSQILIATVQQIFEHFRLNLL